MTEEQWHEGHPGPLEGIEVPLGETGYIESTEGEPLPDVTQAPQGKLPDTTPPDEPVEPDRDEEDDEEAPDIGETEEEAG